MDYDETKDELTNLRAAVRGRADWVFATDDPRISQVLVAMAGAAFAAGVSPGECGCGNMVVTDTDTGASWRVVWVTIPMAAMPAAALDATLAESGFPATGGGARPLIPLSPTAAGAERVREFLTLVGRGRVRLGAADVRAN